MEKCLILDFDDTLVKTIAVHAHAWKLSLERFLDREISIDAIKSDINYGMELLLKKYELTEDEIKIVREHKKEIFSKNVHKTELNKFLLYIIENRFFDHYIIASNSSRENIDKIMTYHNIDQGLFSMIISRDDVKKKKPNPEMGELILKQYENLYKKEDFLLLGDSEVDLTFSNKIGVKCILINC